MSPFLSGLAEVSLAMSLVIAVLLLLDRVLDRRFAPQWRYWAWLAVALRLVLPLNLSLPQAPVTVPVPAGVRVEQPMPEGPPAVYWNAVPREGGLTAPYQAPVGTAGDAVHPVRVTRIPLGPLFTALWAGGCALFLGVQIMYYVTFRKKIKRWSRVTGSYQGIPLWTCECIMSPMLVGLVRPVILVPAAGASEYALLHEAAHARRRDLWYKLLLTVVNALHWFNPLVWLLRRAGERDLEIACDAAVLAGRDEEYRRAYGQALLDTAGQRWGVPMTSTFAGGHSLKRRLLSLLDAAPKRPGRAALALVGAAVILGAGLVACVPGGSEAPSPAPVSGAPDPTPAEETEPPAEFPEGTFYVQYVQYGPEGLTCTPLQTFETGAGVEVWLPMANQRMTLPIAEKAALGPTGAVEPETPEDFFRWSMLSSAWIDALEITVEEGEITALSWADLGTTHHAVVGRPLSEPIQIYTQWAEYDEEAGILIYRQIWVDESDMTWMDPGREVQAAQVAEEVQLLGGYGDPQGVKEFLLSSLASSWWPMGLKLTIDPTGLVTALEWVRLNPWSERADAPHPFPAQFRSVDPEAGTVSGWCLDEAGQVDDRAEFTLPLAEGAAIWLLDEEGEARAVTLEELWDTLAPMDSYGPFFQVTVYEGQVQEIVQSREDPEKVAPIEDGTTWIWGAGAGETAGPEN